MRLLLAVDGSGPSLLATRFVRRMHRDARELSIVLLHVEPSGGDAEARERATTQARAILDEEGVPYELEVVQGDAAAMVVERAQEQDCDFIVLGARGLGALREALLGSVSASVLKNATVPVTIVQ
jgi:nucleotide-binding universal stress UspA family protein